MKEETRTAKTKQMDQLPGQQNPKKSSAERSYVSSDRMLSRSMGKVERKSTLRAKSVKQLPSSAPMTTPSRVPMASSDSKSLKLEVDLDFVHMRNNFSYRLPFFSNLQTINVGISGRFQNFI